MFNRRPGALGPLTWNECLKVISGDWRYSLADIKSFDITAVLKVPSPSPSPSQLKKQASSIDVSSSDMLAVSTALLDVYGDDLAELIVLSTRKEHRRQGHARNLVLNCLTPALREAGVKRLAVALDEGDEEGGAKEMWTKLGFAPIAKSELRRLSWSIPAFGRDSIQGVEYWSLEI